MDPMTNTISSASSPLLPPTGRLVPSSGQFVPTRRQKPVDYTKPGSMLSLMGSESQGMMGQGRDIVGQGQEALVPVIAHLMKLLGGDPQEVEEAILPETQGVLAQYDTARRAVAEFTPRGGGQVSAFANSRIAEASDLASLRSTARRSAVGELSKLGVAQEEVGGRLEGQGLQGLGGVLEGALREAASKRQMWSDLGMGIGMMAATLFAPGVGAWMATKMATGAAAGKTGGTARQ